MAELFNNETCIRWWLPNDEGFSPLLQNIRAIADERNEMAAPLNNSPPTCSTFPVSGATLFDKRFEAMPGMSTSSILLSGTMLTRMTTPGRGIAPPDPTVVVRDPKSLVPQDSDRSGDPDVHPVGTSEPVQNVASLPTLQCWQHGCNGRKFVRRSNLTRHKKRHEGIETLECWNHECNGRKFPNLTSLLRHNKEAQKGYECPRCGGSFTRKYSRNKHIEKCSKSRDVVEDGAGL
jgi:hypothetical protein